MSHKVLSEYQQLQGETSKLLACVGESLIELCQGPPSEEHAEAYVAIDEQIQKFFTVYYDLRKRHELSKLSVAVLALTKSGKSTLINAFLGEEVLPVNNVPETARICRITHSPAADCPEAVLEFKPLVRRASSGASTTTGDILETATSSSSSNSASCNSSRQETVVVVRGAAAVRDHLQQLNRDARNREYINSDNQLLDITAPLMVLESASSAAGHSSTEQEGNQSSIKLCLLDTPGPNEAGEEGLKYQVERLLDHVDAAIYLLDYTKLKTAEEAAVLERLKSINPSLVARLCSRLFFAVNKMDQAGDSCGLDENDTRQYVADMITKQLNCPNFRLHPDQVLLISARNALLSRLVLRHRADADNLRRFSRIAFGAFSTKSNTSSKSPEVLRAAAADMLEESGVPELEQAVLGFLFDAAAGVKLLAVLDDAGRLLAEVSNVATSCRGALAASTSRLVCSSQALQAEMDATLNQFDSIMERTEDLQIEVVDELRAHLGNLRTRLFQYICRSLDTEALYNAAAANAAAAAEAAEAGNSNGRRRHHHHRRCCGRRSHRHTYRQDTDACSSAGSQGEEWDCYCGSNAASMLTAAAGSSGGGWRSLRERFVRVFGSWSSGGCESRDELSSALMDLSEELMAEVQREVSDMWSVMESAANARAGRLVSSLNAAIQELAARLEGVVEEGLQVRLQPVSLRMAAPDACQFHADLTELIEKGIGAEQARHVRSSERIEVVHELRRGVCRLTPYFVPVPRRRRIVETYTSTSYVLKPDAVLEHFIGVVDAAISATESQLAAYVRSYVWRQVETARDKVKEYGDRYLDSMGAALDAASRSADARAAALAQVGGYCSVLAELTDRLTAIQAKAELLVPHNSGTGVGFFEQLDYTDSEDPDQQQQQEEQGQWLAAGEATTAAASGMIPAEVAMGPAAGEEHVAEPGSDSGSGGSSSTGSGSGSTGSGSSSSGSGSSSSSSCPDLVYVQPAVTAEGTLLMQSLPHHDRPQQQQQQQQDLLIDLTATSSDSEDETAPLLQHGTRQQPAPEAMRQNSAAASAASSADSSAASDVFVGSSSDNDLLSVVPDVGGPPAEARETASTAVAAVAADATEAVDIDGAAEVKNTLTAAAASADKSDEEWIIAEEAGAPVAALHNAAANPPADSDVQQQSAADAITSEPLSMKTTSAGVRTEQYGDKAAVGTAAAAAEEILLTVDDVSGGLPLAAASTAEATPTPTVPDLCLIDPDSIAGAQPLLDLSVSSAAEPANAEPPAAMSPAAAAAAPRTGLLTTAQPGSSSAVDPAADVSPTVSSTSARENIASDDYSEVTAGSNSTGFSGMTAGTGFTLGSQQTQGSGTSRLQEHLADSVLAGSTLITTAAANVGAGSSSVYDSGRSSQLCTTGAAPMHNATAAAAGATIGSNTAAAQQPGTESAPLDTSMYASIIAHSADESPTAAGSSGTPGSGGYDFERDFAAALTAAGLDCVAGQGPSDSSSSDDWCLVDEAEVQQQQQRPQ